MKIEFLKFDTNVTCPAGPGLSLSSAHIGEGHQIDYEDGVFYVRHANWGGKFMMVPANRTLGAICIADEDVKRGRGK